MNVSLPETLKDFVNERVMAGGYGTGSEYVRELIRRDRDRLALRERLLAGAASPETEVVGPGYFDDLRRRVRNSTAA